MLGVAGIISSPFYPLSLMALWRSIGLELIFLGKPKQRTEYYCPKKSVLFVQSAGYFHSPGHPVPSFKKPGTRRILEGESPFTG